MGIYVIPATAWQENYGSLFADHDYEGKKSNPEYGLNLSAKNIPQLEPFALENWIKKMGQGKQ